VSTAQTEDGALLEWQSSGDGSPVLLIAGQASSLHGWDSVAEALASDHRVVQFDSRGIGASETGLPESFSTRGFARDAVAVLDAAGVEAAAIVGHSMGGRVAQWLAIDAPERVRRLVLISTTGGDARGVRRTGRATADLTSGNRERLLPLFFSAPFAASHPDMVDAFFDADASRETRRLHFRASGDHDAWDELDRIVAPTLIIHGTDDELTPVGNASRLASAIPGSTLLEVPGALHALHLESQAVQDAVAEFLRD
jgi:pimeloyl-ACP methyl ester carboxylesterase